MPNHSDNDTISSNETLATEYIVIISICIALFCIFGVSLCVWVCVFKKKTPESLDGRFESGQSPKMSRKNTTQPQKTPAFRNFLRRVSSVQGSKFFNTLLRRDTERLKGENESKTAPEQRRVRSMPASLMKPKETINSAKFRPSVSLHGVPKKKLTHFLFRSKISTKSAPEACGTPVNKKQTKKFKILRSKTSCPVHGAEEQPPPILVENSRNAKNSLEKCQKWQNSPRSSRKSISIHDTVYQTPAFLFRTKSSTSIRKKSKRLNQELSHAPSEATTYVSPDFLLKQIEKQRQE